jgi:hypothetical protein
LVGKNDNESLNEVLIESFIEWDIIEIIAITVDNGKNIIKAVNGIEKIELIRCLGQTLSMKILILIMILMYLYWRQYEKKFLLLSEEAKRIFRV